MPPTLPPPTPSRRAPVPPAARTAAPAPWCLAALLLLALAPALAPARAQTFNRQRLGTSTAFNQSRIGRSVAVDGDYAVVGATNNAFFYRWDASAAQWREEQRVSGNAVLGTGFGQSVALSGTCAAVGQMNVVARDQAVHVYCRTGSGASPWALVATRKASDGRDDDEFGGAVALDGDVLVVGAYRGRNAATQIQTGAVYVFARNQGGTDTWGQVQKLNALDAREQHEFGTSVAVRGDELLVGAPRRGTGAIQTTGAGAAYVFRRGAGGAWSQEALLLPRAGAPVQARFGQSVALGDGFAVVGAPNENGRGTDAGEVSVFTRDGTAWPLATRRSADATRAYDWFGQSVAVSDDLVLVGAPLVETTANDRDNMGAATLFRWDGMALTDLTTVSGSLTIDGRFGDAVALSHGAAVIGAPRDGVNAVQGGAAFAFVLVPRAPQNLRASDNSLPDRIGLTWNPVPAVSSTAGYEVFRDGVSIGTATNPSFTDSDLPAGAMHRYAVRARNSIAASAPAEDDGRTRANGRISGTVTGRAGTGVPGVAVTATTTGAPLPSSVALDGVDDAVDLAYAPALDVEDGGFYLEAWIRPTRVDRSFVIYSTQPSGAPGSWQLQVGPLGSSTGRLLVTTPTGWLVASGANRIPAGVWTHVAFRHVPGEPDVLYVNGANAGTLAGTPAALSATPGPRTLGAGAGTGFFAGQIDDVALWDLDEAAADPRARDVRQRLGGGEPGLAGYWRLDDAGRDGAVADYAHGAHGTLRGGAALTTVTPSPVGLGARTGTDGAYTIDRVEYGQGTTYTLTPSLAAHTFDPPQTGGVVLTASDPSRPGVSFRDLTVFSVSGRVRFPGGCPVAGAEVLVNGAVVGQTDATGAYNVSIVTPLNVTVAVRYHGHTFAPASYVYETLTQDQPDQNFTDTTTRQLAGAVVGGDCRLGLGAASVIVSGGANACFTATATVDAQGAYALAVPALDGVDVLAQVTGTPDVRFTPKTVSLRDSAQTVDFVYRTAPVVTLRDLPEAPGTCGTRVVTQLESYGLVVDVQEVYGGVSCPVEDGYVVFRNDASDSPAPDTVAVQGGEAFYGFVAGEPNIASGGTRPYQKLLGIEVVTGGGPAEAYGYSTNADEWLLVEGNRPREQTFATVSPEIPLFILRDPPGDHSYSYLSRESSTCTSLGLSSLRSRTTDLWGRVKFGLEFSFETPIKVSLGFAEWGVLEGGLATTSSQVSQEETELCLTASETFTTDAEDAGEGQDVFVGGAMNFLYALTDVLSFDAQTCTAAVSQDVIFAPGTFATKYVWSEDYVRTNLVPRLRNLRDHPGTPPDSVQFLQDQIDVWNETLALNERLRYNAAPGTNLTFAGRTLYESSTTTTLTETDQLSFVMEIDESVAIEAGIEFAGTGVSGGVRTTMRTEVGRTQTTTRQTSNTVGYALYDDDLGDAFSVNVNTDPVYGTPVFDLVSGESSCRWEPGTRPRDGVALTANTLAQTSVDPGGPAVFALTLANTGQSETDPARQYFIAPLQESNPDGARLTLNGHEFSDGQRYTVPASGSVRSVLTVERGPETYDHPNLQFVAYALCEYEAWQAGRPLQIADTLTVSVQFAQESLGVVWAPGSATAAFPAGAGGTFAARLENESAAPVRFALSGLPGWLTAATSTTLVPSGTAQTVTFTVADTLGVGVHAAIVNAVVDGRAVPLGVTVSVGQTDAPGTVVTQTIPVGAGWTWLSLFAQPSDATPTAALASLADGAADGDVLRGLGGTSQWFDGAWFGGVSSVAPGRAYLLRRANPGALAVTGPLLDPTTPLAVSSGWSYVGYLPQTTLPTDAALASLAAALTDGDVLRSRTGTSQFFGGAWFGSVGQMEPGQGYRLFRASAEPATLVYPAGDPVRGGARGPAAGRSARGADAAWAFDPSRFEHAMSVTAALDAAGADVRLGAFVGDELRGVAHAVYVPPLEAYRYVVTVFGGAQDGETVTFRRLGADGAEVPLAATVAFLADAIVGSIAEPLALGAGATAAAHDAPPTEFAVVRSYPNPARGTVRVDYTLPSAGEVSASVVDALGRTVARLDPGLTAAGRHTLTWDASGAAPGVYLVVLHAAEQRRVHQLLVIR